MNPVLMLFLMVIFSIVFVEQSFNSWLPSFYKNHLKVNSFFALQATSFLALFSYVGRIITAHIIRRFSLSKYYVLCLSFILLILTVIVSISYFDTDNSQTLLFLFPVIGLFLSPLYPVINSKMISQVDRSKANLFTSMIVILSSLGSSVSSIVMALLFENQLLNYYSVYILCAVSVIFIISLIYFRFADQKT